MRITRVSEKQTDSQKRQPRRFYPHTNVIPIIASSQPTVRGFAEGLDVLGAGERLPGSTRLWKRTVHCELCGLVRAEVKQRRLALAVSHRPVIWR